MKGRTRPARAARVKARPARPRTATKTGKAVATRKGRSRRAGAVSAGPAELAEVESLRAELERLARHQGPPRWNASPEEVRRAVMKLVLTLVELIRRLLERQAIRRLEAKTLTPDETEAVGQALMRLEETIRELAAQFDLSPEDLNLDLGPMGRLM